MKSIGELCRGDADTLAGYISGEKRGGLPISLLWIILGSSIYGASIGFWRSPLQALYVAVKFPMLILLTTLGNGMLNGITAQLLGAEMSFRESLKSVFLSFSVSSIILGAVSPLTFFLVLSAPAMNSESAKFAHTVVILSDVAVIAFAGTVANLHLFRLLKKLNGNGMTAVKILFSWLAGNLLLGGQLSWIMRPFIGTPSAPVEFFRNNPLDGNFFETVWKLIMNLFI